MPSSPSTFLKADVIGSDATKPCRSCCTPTICPEILDENLPRGVKPTFSCCTHSLLCVVCSLSPLLTEHPHILSPIVLVFSHFPRPCSHVPQQNGSCPQRCIRIVPPTPHHFKDYPCHRKAMFLVANNTQT